MDTVSIAERSRFDAAKLAKNALFASAHMFCDVYCLEPGQAQKVHAHDGSDKVYLVLDGIARVTIGDEEAELPAGTAVIARSGEPHGVRNASEARCSLLVVMAPKPGA